MYGIEYILEDLSSHPKCSHGPTLLFSRCVNDSGERRKFFACAACRDRKLCNFFLWEDEKDTNEEAKKMMKSFERQKLQKIDHREVFILLNEIQQMNEKQRIYCTDCNSWVLSKNIDSHKEHKLITGITDKQISFPSTFLSPLSNDKREAQYLFTDSSVSVIINILQKLNIRNVLNIGAPRIQENILNNHQHMTSLLLDFDHRYHNFYGPLQFCWYNLFNHHFFLKESEDVFKDFLQTDDGSNFAIVIDPPFGGRSEPICQTLKKIEAIYRSLNSINNNLPIFLFYPYFMEPQLIQSPIDFKMVDYKVDYDNHALFQQGNKGRKFGSPVRMFTNLSLSDIALPEEEGYKFCDKCCRWVYKENQHCEECDSCSSKDGRTYIHCKKCSRCVKPTWVHCKKCDRCAQPDHKCGDIRFNKSCFHCKEQGHKKSECPKVNHDLLKRKRNKNIELKLKNKIRKKYDNVFDKLGATSQINMCDNIISRDDISPMTYPRHITGTLIGKFNSNEKGLPYIQFFTENSLCSRISHFLFQ